MAGSFAAWEVDDPHNLTQSLAERFPPPREEVQQYWARTYHAADWRQHKIDPASYRTRIAVGLMGGVGGQGGLVSLADIQDHEATVFSIQSPGLDFYCLTFIREGAAELRPPANGRPIQLAENSAFLFKADPKTALLTSAGSKRLNVWIPTGLLRRHATRLLDVANVQDIDFDKTVDCRAGAGASLRRLCEFILSELAQPASIFTSPISAAPVEELLIHGVLMGLSHDGSGALRRDKSAAPANIRRAEDFIVGHADDAITVEDVARIAGCSVRALQLGFRRFRNTSPMEALRRARLERARVDLLNSNGTVSIIDIAMRHGFGHAGRFSAAYRHRYGEHPSETLKARKQPRR